MKNKFFVVLLGLLGCGAAGQLFIKDVVDGSGAICTATSIVLQDPVLGIVCTDAEELLQILLNWPKGAATTPITTHDLELAVIKARRAKSQVQ